MMTDAAMALPPRAGDSRKFLRQRVYLSGRIIYGDGSFTINCRIRDISECGARIVLSVGMVIPTHNILVQVGNRIVHDAAVARIASPEFGLKFISTHSLDAVLPPHMQYLKRYR
ncbi:MAG TPA: PilZ domain-containing protein [Micropepsaceae bacterium]|jgi:hypothetical protein